MTENTAAEIRALKKELGDAVTIAAHHYQRPQIVALADLVGDSYKLAREASRTTADFIVLCGVRFMAESAAIVARPGQTVLIPDTAAGCPMADMIDQASAERAYTAIAALRSARAGSAAVGAGPLVPVTYMNSYADVKAFTGERGGSICTSSNAGKILARYLNAGAAVFFLPDYNLGINTALAMGLDESSVFTVRKDFSIEGSGDPSRGRLFLWDGYCHVHKRFTVEDVRAARARYPQARVIVHPECDRAVVAASDLNGSTEYIYKIVAAAPAGSAWVVGTEGSFVERLAAEFTDRTVIPLRVSVCFNMARIDLSNLAATLRSIRDRAKGGPLLFPIDVAAAQKQHAETALRTMMEITESAS